MIPALEPTRPPMLLSLPVPVTRTASHAHSDRAAAIAEQAKIVECLANRQICDAIAQSLEDARKTVPAVEDVVDSAATTVSDWDKSQYTR